MANMELVTSHQGSPHITVDQVRELFAGLSGDLTGIKVFSNLDDSLNYTITDVLQIEIGKGQGLAGGFFFQLLDKFTWNLDPGTVGYSRIDMLFLVIYEDSLTNIQSIDLLYVPGLDYPNGGSGAVPETPTGTNIKEAFPLYRADVKDGSILSVTSYALPYLSNQDLKTAVSDYVEQVQTNTNEIAQMKVTFQDGVDTIYNGLTTRGMSPTASTPEALSDAVGEGLGNLYDYAWAYGHDSGIGHDDATIDEVKSAIDAITEVTWTEELQVNGTGKGGYGQGAVEFSTKNVISIKATEILNPAQTTILMLYDADMAPISEINVNVGTTYTIPNNVTIAEIYVTYEAGSTTVSPGAKFQLTRQAKILR